MELTLAMRVAHLSLKKEEVRLHRKENTEILVANNHIHYLLICQSLLFAKFEIVKQNLKGDVVQKPKIYSIITQGIYRK